jgi:hypothetical protein
MISLKNTHPISENLRALFSKDVHEIRVLAEAASTLQAVMGKSLRKLRRLRLKSRA